MWQPLSSPLGRTLQQEALWSVQWLAALLLAYGLQTTAWHLYLTLLVLQIHGCELINIIGHIVHLHYLTMERQPSPLTLCPPDMSVSLLLFRVHADVT